MTKNTLSQPIDFADRIFLWLLLSCVIFSLLMISVNHYDLKFSLPTLFIGQFPQEPIMQMTVEVILGVIFLIYIMRAQTQPLRRFAILWWGFALFAWSVFANLLMCEFLLSTPFQPIDYFLVKMDTAIGIDTPRLMMWTYHHPLLQKILTISYNTIQYQIFLIPLLLTTFFSEKKSAQVFYLATMMTALVGCMIYYFFPTVSPAGVYKSGYFTQGEINTALRFSEVHHHLALSASGGGLIAFPSFHVMWALLLTYACRTLSGFVFYPLVMLNVLLIASTVLLGWHYGVDVIAAFALVVAALYFSEAIVGQNHYVSC